MGQQALHQGVVGLVLVAAFIVQGFHDHVHDQAQVAFLAFETGVASERLLRFRRCGLNVGELTRGKAAGFVRGERATGA